MMTNLRFLSALLVAIASTATTTIAFAPPTLQRSVTSTKPMQRISPLFSSPDNSDASDDKAKKSQALQGNMRSKLLSETIAPWRAIRLFLYGALGSGAFIGGLINGSGAIAASASPEFNLNTELMNIGIDFGAVAIFALLFKFDIGKQGELEAKVEEKVERKKEMSKIAKSMKEREKALSGLNLEITITEDGQTQTANVGELQRGAKQHMIIVAGPKMACKDALIGASLLKMDFAMGNVLVVPYRTDVDEQPSAKVGFGDRPAYETQPFVARAMDPAWKDVINAEMKDAIEQNGAKAKEEGIAIVVANSGKIIRRGVGTVPWRTMVDQLNEEVNPTASSGPLPWL